MKLSKWIYGIAALGMFAACAGNDIPETPGGQDENVPDGYIAVNLCLPTNSGTRANDVFDDGEESEYAVKNGALVLFKGEEESSAVYCGAYSLGLTEFAPGDKEEGNVTTTYRRAVEVKGLNLTDKDKLYGLVLINYDQAGFTLKEKSGLKVSTVDGDFDFTPTTTFATLLGKMSSMPFYDGEVGKIAKSIFMTNSPLVIGTPGGQNEVPAEVKIQTLVDLTGGIKSSEEEALKAPAGTIYVERAVAKVQCSTFMTYESLGETGFKTDIVVSDGNENKNLYVKNIQWGISNQEANSYIVRNVDGIDWSLHSESMKVDKPYRMVGFTGMRQNMDLPPNDETNPYMYRPYWGIDPNYDNDKPKDTEFHNLLAWDGGQVFYPHENTFSVEYQTYRNTTRVGFWVTFSLGEDGDPVTFYTRGKDKSTFYFDKKIENGETIDPLEADVMAELSENESVRNAWYNALDKQEPGSASWNVKEYLTIETEVINSGAVVLKSIAFKADKASVYKDGKLPEFDFTDLISELNIKYSYYQYVGGKAFYDVMIKHFGDDLTPWVDEGSASTIDEAYPIDNRDNNYLGRYGLLRNNWYELKVDKLLDLGEPRDPATWDEHWDDTPDDNKAQYIAVRIAILSWAKRTQSVEF